MYVRNSQSKLANSFKNRNLKIKESNKRNYHRFVWNLWVRYFWKKQPLTIISKRDNNFLSKVKSWLTGNAPIDFEEGDTLKDVVFKYAGNKESGLVYDIGTKFGKKD